MTSTLALTNSAANSGSDQCAAHTRQSVVRFCPSMKPNRRSSSNIATKGGVRGEPDKPPMRYVRPACCASAANGHVTLAPISAMNSRRLMVSLTPRTTPYHAAGVLTPC
jgi:hypothetical protein